ncbi:uncharacterized protein LOC134222365 [Armigeres subalbatus]|uniref:uncharacterized protein LOC134222365 n=1 Tax=Armigeres subalbatus TaxID=124917 RepID=UPI002ED333F4
MDSKCIHPLLEDNSPFIPKLQRIVERFKKALLNVEIKHTFYVISKLTHERDHVRVILESNVGDEILHEFLSTQQRSYDNRMHTQQRTIGAKLNRLIAQTSAYYDATPSLNEKAVTNATNLSVPIEMQTLLSLGPKFALPTNERCPNAFYHFIADIESILNQSPDKSVQDRNRCQVVTHIQNHLARNKSDSYQAPVQKFCEQAVKITRRFLAEHDNVIALESDKGKRMVIMYREQYDTKMLALLNDDTYKVVPRDPTSKFQTHNNNIIKRLLDLHLIDAPTYRKLKTTTSICPRIYGQPKAHKPDLPLRPVVPNMTSPTYHLSKYIASILKQSSRGQFNITDSFDFVNHINRVTLPQGYVLVSFDVVSLFTNIPKDLVIRDIITNWDDIQQATNICLDLLLEMVEFCLDTSYFCFRNKFYIQTFGTAMGSPLSPILADIVMDSLLHTVNRLVPYPMPVLKKYVDDLILALPEDKIHEVLDIFNGYNPHLQFTVEKESNNKLPFLDTLITRHEDQTLSTSWYSKPIASGRLMNFHSFHPTTMKINIASNYIDRDNNQTYDQSPITTQLSSPVSQPSSCHQHSSTTSPQHQMDPNSINSATANMTSAPNSISIQNPHLPTQTAYKSIPFIPQLTTNIAHCLKIDYPQVKDPVPITHH